MSFKTDLIKFRYRYVPDHILGEILSKIGPDKLGFGGLEGRVHGHSGGDSIEDFIPS